jgi:hypothetical protein
MSKLVLIIIALIVALSIGLIYIKISPIVSPDMGSNSLFQQQKEAENGTMLEEEIFDVKPIPEEQIPVVDIVNQSFSNISVNIKQNWRVKFTNKDNITYTLVIPDIGIEEELTPEASTEPTFYKKGNITFWIKELGINATNGTVYVE